jgi:hypothetical protein
VKLRRQGSNLRLAINSRASYRLDYAETRRRQQDSNLRAAEAAYALATRCLSYSAMPPQGGRRGSRTPKTRRPTRFRDGIPRQWQSFREWPRQASNLHFPGQEPGALPFELRSRDVAGRDRTCGAPRFRRALYRLSYGHMMGEAGVEPAASSISAKRSSA